MPSVPPKSLRHGPRAQSQGIFVITEKYKKAPLAKLKDVQEGLLIGRANFDVTRNPPKEEVKQLHGHLNRETMLYE